ncbi:Aldo/keto reductase [Obba rivulosa]|uniref:Aldo/keto reductase n=1 Tax=Obba rivulosa TaxID=1052685 RepID=A0A8E2AX04_9APHY|nr:Aldo/keto reductase [Obba rivulosa]
MSFRSHEWVPWVIDEDVAIPLLKGAWDRSVATIDTANIYSNGESENVIAKLINIPRENLIIATKCYGLVHCELGDTRDYVNKSGFSRGSISNAIGASLKRLETPYIDLLQIHHFDPNTPLEETMKALHDLVQSGKVRYIGASSMRCWQFAQQGRFVSMRDEHSLVYREDEQEMLAYCKYHGIGVIPWALLATGHLARPLGTSTTRVESTKDSPRAPTFRESDKAIINRVEELAKKKGVKMSQIALAWANLKVTSPIRLDDAILKGLELSDEEVKYLEAPYEPQPIRGHA